MGVSGPPQKKKKETLVHSGLLNVLFEIVVNHHKTRANIRFQEFLSLKKGCIGYLKFWWGIDARLGPRPINPLHPPLS